MKDKILGFFRSLNEKDATKAFLASMIAIVCGLCFGFIILLFSNAEEAGDGFVYILKGCFGDTDMKRGIGLFLAKATPLLFTGLAVAFAFKTGLFNIGASGQFTVGMFAAIVVGLCFKDLANLGILYWIICLLAGMAAGALWGFFPGICKALFNVNEVITAIMFNYIGMYLVNMIIKSSKILYNSTKTITHVIPAEARTPKWFFETMFPGSGADISFLIAIACAIIAFVVLYKTKQGYELRACGFNRNGAKYAGINEKKNIILAMTISGLFAGLGGALFILNAGGSGTGTYYKPEDAILAYGFNGIPVALLAVSNPIGVIFSALFITYIQRGGFYLQRLDFRNEIIDIMVATIIYFSAFALIIKESFGKLVKSLKNVILKKPKKTICDEEGEE